jgi:hypothetical protein
MTLPKSVPTFKLQMTHDAMVLALPYLALTSA